MRSVIITALLLIFTAGGLSAQVETTFKTVANGEDQINGNAIAVPVYSLTPWGGGSSLHPGHYSLMKIPTTR
jgi:hypothetical protein